MNHAIIFGGTKGLGRVVVRQLAKRGDKVTVIGRSNALEDPPSSDVQYFKCDMADKELLINTLEEVIKTRGKINYCVFLQRYRGKENDWDGEFQTTIIATKNAVDYLTPHFSPEGDKGIVMVSSVFSKYVGEGQSGSYHVGKAGLDQLMRYYAVNLGSKSIRVNSIMPFTFLKEESKSFYENNMPLMEHYKNIIPLGRMATTEDSANIINFLCSSQASFITGQNITVDGGLSLLWPETLTRRLMKL
jgi:NAD(P)-dependent dehydrogenase (short-subunit alcohol dehydrogenase family)